ncbi:META domain-containing protein [Schumannella soli]|uniref:META domain-containing protein n=1 Tax=Schumannella soli TaxID=2590779 RepID=A0A506XPT1_9MICO|nr:META domain-containing protein [Schumannella soli]TPW74641.1 META domain-containing protein [Schumannella soli]
MLRITTGITAGDRLSAVRAAVAGAGAALLALGLLSGCASGSSDGAAPGAGGSGSASATPGGDESAGSQGSGGSSGGSLEADVAQLWLLTSITDDQGTLAPPTVSATLDLREDGRFSGNGGCNGFGADVKVGDSGHVTVGPIVSTKRACAERSANEQETRYLAALQKADAVKRSGDGLIVSGDGIQLVYAPDATKSAGPKTDGDQPS